MLEKKGRRMEGHQGKPVNRLKYSVLIIWRLRMTYECLVSWDSSKIHVNFACHLLQSQSFGVGRQINKDPPYYKALTQNLRFRQNANVFLRDAVIW